MPNHPYAQPIGALTQIILHLRSSFPGKVDAAVLKKLGIASNNESYIINTLKFIGVIDNEGNRIEDAHKVFVLGDDEFLPRLADMVKSAYKGLFGLYDESAWTLEKARLVSFFRTEDKSTELVGSRQADTFIRLSELAGKRAIATAGNAKASKREGRERHGKAAPKRKADSTRKGSPETGISPPGTKQDGHTKDSPVSLAVRIEVNLPATSDQAVYDAIFKSIRANLIDRD